MTYLKFAALIFIGVPVTYLGIVHGIAGLREARTLENFPAQGIFTEVDGAKVHAVVEGEGPDVVLIHGAGGNTRDFTFTFSSALAERGYRVITFDRPGFGYSDPINEDPASIQLQADRLVKAAAALGAEKPIVIGHSLGGAVSMAWATRHPDNLSGLLPLAAVTNEWPGPPDALYRYSNSVLGSIFMVPALSAFISNGYIENVLNGVFDPQPFVEGYDKYIGAALTIRRQSLLVNAAERVALKENVLSLVPDYPAITVPVEIVHGNKDASVSLELHSVLLAEQIPGANLTVLEGIGHMPHHVSEAAVLDAVDRIAERAGLK